MTGLGAADMVAIGCRPKAPGMRISLVFAETALALLAAFGVAGCHPVVSAGDPAPAQETKAAPASGAVNPGVAVVQTYLCSDGRSVVAGYPDSDTAVVTWNDHAYTLKVARSASGARYTGYGLQWWTKGLTHAALAQLKPGEEIASAVGIDCDVKDDAPVDPPPPGSAGGLPDDRTPLSEAPFTATSAQGAAGVVQTYYALIEEGHYADAARLWRAGAGFDPSPYASYHAQVGGPGESEGAAGSIFIEVPVVIYGRRKSGAELHQSGKVTLRRVNDVPGSTAEQRLWRIERIDLR